MVMLVLATNPIAFRAGGSGERGGECPASVDSAAAAR
jgi:hypothetical protein